MPVVKYVKYPTTSAAWKWNAAAADAIVKAGGFALLKAAHAWFDDADGDVPEVKGAYKLPHHLAEGDALVTPWRGVVAAMTAVLGGRGGVDVPAADRKGIYDHLAKHYAEFEKEPPAFKTLGDGAELCPECGMPEDECACPDEMPEDKPMPKAESPVKYTKPTAGNRFFGGVITKADFAADGTCEITAIASTDDVDRMNEIVDQPSLAACLADYMAFGAVREMHGWAKGVGKCLEAGPVVLEGGGAGVKVRIMVGDDECVKKVRLGIYGALSIGFSCFNVMLERDANGAVKMVGGQPVYRLFVKKLYEISLVDSPGNASCLVDSVKSDHKALIYKFEIENNNPLTGGEKEEDMTKPENEKNDTSAPSWMGQINDVIGKAFAGFVGKALAPAEADAPKAKAEDVSKIDVDAIVAKAVDTAVEGASKKFAIAAAALEKVNADLAAELAETKTKAEAADAEAKKAKAEAEAAKAGAEDSKRKAKAIMDQRAAFQTGVAEDADNLDVGDGIKAHIRAVARGEVKGVDRRLALKACVAAGLDEGWLDASAMNKK